MCKNLHFMFNNKIRETLLKLGPKQRPAFFASSQCFVEYSSKHNREAEIIQVLKG